MRPEDGCDEIDATEGRAREPTGRRRRRMLLTLPGDDGAGGGNERPNSGWASSSHAALPPSPLTPLGGAGGMCGICGTRARLPAATRPRSPAACTPGPAARTRSTSRRTFPAWAWRCVRRGGRWARAPRRPRAASRGALALGQLHPRHLRARAVLGRGDRRHPARHAASAPGDGIGVVSGRELEAGSVSSSATPRAGHGGLRGRAGDHLELLGDEQTVKEELGDAGRDVRGARQVASRIGRARRSLTSSLSAGDSSSRSTTARPESSPRGSRAGSGPRSRGPTTENRGPSSTPGERIDHRHWRRPVVGEQVHPVEVREGGLRCPIEQMFDLLPICAPGRCAGWSRRGDPSPGRSARRA